MDTECPSLICSVSGVPFPVLYFQRETGNGEPGTTKAHASLLARKLPQKRIAFRYRDYESWYLDRADVRSIYFYGDSLANQVDLQHEAESASFFHQYTLDSL
jgi:hypothetical protein